MGAKKKPSKKGKPKGTGLAVALMILFAPVVAQAEGLRLLEDDLTLKYLPTMNMGTTNANERGGGVMGTIGPLVSYSHGDNMLISLEFSGGLSVMPDTTAGNTQNADIGFAGGPCWLNRTLCTHWGKRIDPATGDMVNEFKFGWDVMPYVRGAASSAGL